MELYPSEARRVMEAGGKLTRLIAPQPFTRRESYPMGAITDEPTGIVYQVMSPGLVIRKGRGMWLFDKDCPFLVRDPDGSVQCGDYDNRMDICHEFQEGGHICQKMRQEAGLDDTDLETRFNAIQEREAAEVDDEIEEFYRNEDEERAALVLEGFVRLLTGGDIGPTKPALTKRTGSGVPKKKSKKRR